MPLRLRRFAGAAHPKVRLLFTSVSFPNNRHISVWGVIWLIQALIFFALGVIVGLVAFKVKKVHVLLEIF